VPKVSQAILDAQLPRGPHRLSRDEVADSQRQRLYLAILDVIAEEGYQAVNVASLVARAKISRRTFYELFDSKEECFAASFDTMVKVILARLTNTIQSAGPLGWRDLVCTSLAAYLNILAAEPAMARALHLAAPVAGPALEDYRRQLMTIFVDRMRAARDLAVERGELSASLPDEVIEFLIGGIDERIRDYLQRWGPTTLPSLSPTLSMIALMLLDNGASSP